ncbi:MAG: HD domain-containing protein [Anaerotruncus sp.]|nr:HD domain-containing protein [Anaerotruncus sp.]
MEYDLKKLEKLAKSTLSEKRFHHTACVVKQAYKLAKFYGCDVYKAEVAAWLHDICKEMKQEEQLKWLTKYGIILDSIQRSQPKTWHGMAACGYMKFELGIEDEEILRAVRYHTTACGEMHMLDEVIYLADLTSEERDYADVKHMRKLAETAAKPAMKYAMCYALSDLVERGQGISRDSFEAYNYYIQF